MLGAVEVVDTQADLNAYAQVENQAACCAPPRTASLLPVVELGGATTPAAPVAVDDSLHRGLVELFARYNVNEYAASVRVYAVKP